MGLRLLGMLLMLILKILIIFVGVLAVVGLLSAILYETRSNNFYPKE